jgi:phosphomannomutase
MSRATSTGGLIATHSGLRGRVGSDLTGEVVGGCAAAFVELLRGLGLDGAIALARDGRATSADLADAARAAILATGSDLVDLGVTSTPAAKLAARRRGLAGLFVVTGSHLGEGWNGVKLAAAPLFGPLDVRRLPDAAALDGAGPGRPADDPDAPAEHAAAVVAAVDAAAVRAAGIAAEVAGAPDAAAGLVLDRLGCRRGDGIGLALDADGDRLLLTDEEGRRLDPETTLALAALARRPALVVKGADTGRLVDLLVAPRGGRVIVVPTGELHLVEALVAYRAGLAGEGNGGVVVPEVGLARDGLAAAAVVLELVARARRPLARIVDDLPPLARVRSTLEWRDAQDALATLRAVGRRLGAPLVADARLGVRVERPDGAWGLVRLSGTEPVMRVTAEAATAEQAQELHDRLRAELLAG